MVSDLTLLFERDITKLETEIAAFRNENNLWRSAPGVTNPAGNLCLHLVGNLRTYIGKNIGHIAYTRDRDAEFNLRNLPQSQLVAMVNDTSNIVTIALSRLTEKDLDERYTENVFDFEMTNGYFLAHLLGHLSYHLGQVNYLRRILEVNEN
jgi:uncharacterized damage-inducible protein DinB